MNKTISIQRGLVFFMKISLVNILIASVSLAVASPNTGNGQELLDKRITVDIENTEIKDALAIVGEQADVKFTYSPALFAVTEKVSVHLVDAKLSDVLSKLLKDGVTFKVIGSQIALNPGARSKSKLSQMERVDLKNLPFIPITGTITNEKSEPLPGVSILIKGTNQGTITNAEGKFTIDGQQGQTLLISSLGYKTREFTIEAQTAINVQMELDVTQLAEIMVVGYGVQKKSDITGAIVSVGAEDLKDRSPINVGQALQGKIAGVQIMNLSSAPGSSPTFRVRGYSSNGQSNPLFIVDGLKVTDIGYLAPNSIDHIEVLKDAASAAIYGAQAGNGVVLITTKSGKPGTSRIFYNSLYTSQSQRNKMKMMDGPEFQQYWMEAGQPAAAFQGADTDWNKVVFEKGNRLTQIVGFEGGSEKSTFYSAITYNSDNGMVVGNQDTYKRLAAQINATYDVNSWLKVGTTNSFERAKINNVSQNSATASGSVIGGAYFYDPTVPVYYPSDANAPAFLLQAEAQGAHVLRNSDGQLYGTSLLQNSDLWHPLGMIENYTRENWRTNLNGTLYAEFKPVKGLVYTSRVGYRFGNNYNSVYSDSHYWNPSQVTAYGALNQDLSHNVYIQWENFATYNFALGNHNFTALAGMQYFNDNNSGVGGSTSRLQNDAPNFRYLDYSTTDATDAVTGNNINQRNISYFGRVGWNYQDKYMIQGTFRADAFDASKLPADNRWGYFPAVSGGWTVSNENFMKNLSVNPFSHLKFRASWGINGNVNALNGYPYISPLVLGGNSGNYSFTNQLIPGAAPASRLPNPNIAWEKSVQTDIGLDAGFLNDRLTLGVDYFNKITDGLLAPGPAPVVSGNNEVMRNNGKIQNKGFEFELGWKEQRGDFHYNIRGNLATLHNEVLESPYGDGRFSGGGGFGTAATYFEKGYPIWYLRTFMIDHIDATNGQPIYKTAAELGTDDGRGFAGSGIPKFNYGVTLSTGYKNFDLTIFGAGQQGSELLFAVIRPDLPIANLPEFVYSDRWTPEHPDAKRAGARVMQTSAGQYAVSNDWVFNSSFFKIKQLQLGYTFPSTMLSHLKMTSLRIYTSLEDFFLFTKYPGIEPESMAGTQNGTVLQFGPGATFSLGGGLSVDRIQYPAMKQVVFGLNLSF